MLIHLNTITLVPKVAKQPKLNLKLLLVFGGLVVVGLMLLPRLMRKPASGFYYQPAEGIGSEKLKSYAKDEPAFRIMPPQGWILVDQTTPRQRLAAVSPEVKLGSQSYRALVGVNIHPAPEGFEAEVNDARTQLQRLTVDGKFLDDSSKLMKFGDTQTFEYLTPITDQDDVTNLEAMDKQAVLHSVDILVYKDGYLLDVHADVHDWLWDRYAADFRTFFSSFQFL